jgi:hypothetical protein
MIFPNVKKSLHTQSNSDAIARWSSITFFFIHPVLWTYISGIFSGYIGCIFITEIYTIKLLWICIFAPRTSQSINKILISCILISFWNFFIPTRFHTSLFIYLRHHISKSTCNSTVLIIVFAIKTNLQSSLCVLSPKKLEYPLFVRGSDFSLLTRGTKETENPAKTWHN